MSLTNKASVADDPAFQRASVKLPRRRRRTSRPKIRTPRTMRSAKRLPLRS